MGRKSNVSDTKQSEAVLALRPREEPAAVLARRYGVSESTLHKWRERFVDGGRMALANGRGTGDAQSQRIQALERAVAERDRVVGELTLANLHASALVAFSLKKRRTAGRERDDLRDREDGAGRHARRDRWRKRSRVGCWRWGRRIRGTATSASR